MYGPGNHAPQAGQGSYASIPSFHLRAHAPPPPPLSQMSQPPQMTASPLPLPCHICQTCHHVFQNVPPQPPAQPYFAPPPLPRSCGSSRFQHHKQWTQTPHFLSPAGLALSMAQQGSPLLGQTVYRGQLSQKTASSSGFHASFHAGGILPSGVQTQNMPATGLRPPPPLPPLPSSPPPGSPPLPPSLPSDVSLEIDPSGLPNAKLGEIASDSIKAVSVSSLTADHVCRSDCYMKCDGENGSKVDSESVILHFPPPPPRPTDARTLRNIELVCHFIAENGLQYEDMLRQSEIGNTELSFLFGDEQGSENTTAHEYFLWMKKKCQLVDEEREKSDPIERQKETSASQSKSCIPNSPVDSDVGLEGPHISSKPVYAVVQKSFAKADESVKISSQEVGSHLDRNTHDLSSSNKDFYLESAPTAAGDSRSEKFTGVMDAGPEGILESNKSLGVLDESYINQGVVTSDTGFSSNPKESEDFVQKVHYNQDSVIHGSCHGGLGEDNIERESRSTFDIKEDSKSMAALPKLDEFGRLVREGVSESDSEGSPRHNRRRDRSRRRGKRSRSRSPYEKRKRRSPLRRKNRRGRSRSLSPEKHRSRSRSPPHRHRGESGGDKIKRGKGVTTECLDFLRGKCYREASCHYMDRDDKSERSRSYRSKMQRQDLSFSSRRSEFIEKMETSEKTLLHDHNEGGLKTLNTQKDGLYRQVEKMQDEPARCLPKEEDHSEQGVLPNPGADNEELQSVTTHSTPSRKNLEPEQAEEQICIPIDQSVNIHDAEMRSSASHSLTDCSSICASIQNSIDKPLNLDSSDNPASCFSSMIKPISSESLKSQSVVPTEPVPPGSASDLSQVHPPSFSSLAQKIHDSHTTQSLKDSRLVLPSPNYPPNGLAMCQASVSYAHAQYPPLIPFWDSLPPPSAHTPAPRSMLGINTIASLVHGQYGTHVPVQVLAQPPMMNFSIQKTIRPCTTNSSSIGLHQAYPSKQELNEASHPRDELQANTIAGNQPIIQPHGGHKMVGGQHFPIRALPASYPLSSIPPENVIAQGMPLSSKFSSNLSTHEMDRQYGSRYGTAFGLNHLAVNGSGVPSVISKHSISPRNSAQAVHDILPGTGGDQYDPLHDSLEPSSNYVRKSDLSQKHETSKESDFRSRFNGFNKPLDLDENCKKVASGAVPESNALENEECGKTTDAEVDALENESSSNLNDAASDESEEEVEKKKSTESRSMIMFKFAVAQVVKEVLKPSWRQSNMSKEAFNTIVKKTVNKVAKALESRYIPKSQKMINHFIGSS